MSRPVGATALVDGVEVNEAQSRACLRRLRNVIVEARQNDAGRALAAIHGDGWDAGLDFIVETIDDLITAHTEHIGDSG